MLNSKTTAAVLLTSAFLTAASSAAVITHNFNSTGVNHGWTAAETSGAGQATGIDGSSGVFTSTDVTGGDPKLNYNSGNAGATLITLGAGETWSTFSFRFRQLSDNPGAGGVASSPFSETGTLIFFNGATNNLGTGAPGNGDVSGGGGFAGDTYGRTLTAQADNWQLFTIDLTSAPALNSLNITSFRFDPVGNDAAKNFEVDFATFTSVPEPSSAMLLGLAGVGLLIRRRK